MNPYFLAVLRLCLFLLLCVYVCKALASPPAWRIAPPVVSSSSSAPAVVYRVKHVTDTLRITDTVTVQRTDTLRISDTISVYPVQHKYVVRYALTALNVDMANPEWLDYASYNEIVARDTATLRIGAEEIRELGSAIDQFGNKIPQTDIVTTGFTIQIFGDRATIEYRGKNSVAVFSGNFDANGLLYAIGEVTETNFLASIFPFNFIFKSGRKKIIIEILREAYL